MTEPLVDLRGLHDHKVEHVLIGAVAMLFYGYVRNPEDLDIAVNPARDNVDRVADWLISIKAVLKLNPARPFGSRERWGLHKGPNATVLTSMGQIDVVQRLPGLPDWPQLLEQAEVYEIEALEIRVLSRLTLIDLKRRRGSHLDLADISSSRRSIASEVPRYSPGQPAKSVSAYKRVDQLAQQAVVLGSGSGDPRDRSLVVVLRRWTASSVSSASISVSGPRARRASRSHRRCSSIRCRRRGRRSRGETAPAVAWP